MRAGAIVPMLRPTIDTLSPTTPPERVDSYANDAGVLYVRIVPSDSASSLSDLAARSDQRERAIKEHDRRSQRVRLVRRRAPRASTDRRRHRRRFSGGQTFVSGAVLEILRAEAVPESVTRNDTALQRYDTLAALEAATDGWFWEPAMGGRLWVKVPDGTQHVTVCRPS